MSWRARVTCEYCCIYRAHQTCINPSINQWPYKKWYCPFCVENFELEVPENGKRAQKRLARRPILWAQPLDVEEYELETEENNGIRFLVQPVEEPGLRLENLQQTQELFVSDQPSVENKSDQTFEINSNPCGSEPSTPNQSQKSQFFKNDETNKRPRLIPLLQLRRRELDDFSLSSKNEPSSPKNKKTAGLPRATLSPDSRVSDFVSQYDEDTEEDSLLDVIN